MTKELTSFSDALDEFRNVRNDLESLTSIKNTLLDTNYADIPPVIHKLVQKLQEQKQRLSDIKTFTDMYIHNNPYYNTDMNIAITDVEHQITWLNAAECIYNISNFDNQNDKEENPTDLAQIVDYLKKDRHNIVDLFFEKIQTYKDEDRTFSLLVDLSNPADIGARVETDISIGQIQGPFLKIFTLATDEADGHCTKDKLYTIVDEQTKTLEQTINNPVTKKKITVTIDDKRRLTDILDDEEAKYFLKELATYETECASSEDWLTWTDHANKIQQIDYYKSLKTDRERQIYATAIGHQYALDFLCSPIEELLRAYDLDVVNTFFKTVELVIN